MSNDVICIFVIFLAKILIFSYSQISLQRILQQHRKNMTDTYHKDSTRIGKSGLDLVHRSPAHYYAKYLDPNREWEEPTPALILGSAVHCAVFESEKFSQQFAVAPVIDKRSNAGKAAWADFQSANQGKQLLTSEQFDTCMKMKAAVHAHPTAKLLLEGGVAEQRIDWLEPHTLAKCKSKLDWQSDNGFIVDLKTTEDAGPTGFAKSIANYRYHVQGAFYLDAYQEKYGQPARGFIFIAVEKTPPFAVALYYLTQEDIDFGRMEYLADLEVYLRCLRNNEWPAYGTEVKPISLPAWARRRNTNYEV
jgi:hypothetical protein